MLKKTESLWAGTEGSLSEYLEAVVRAAASPQLSPQDTPAIPGLLDIQGSVGVISIQGPLTNKDSWINSYMGVTSYNSIREAMIYAAQDPGIKQILLNIDSGGGSVAGVDDTGSLISLVNDKIKPVTAFTDGTMASAAYWLGASAGKVYASKTAMVGSIGVIATHMEQSQALKDAGIGVTVLRAGKYKALANGVEPLTDAAKAQLQEHLDTAYTVFVQHVADARQVSYAVADSKMAQGREFMGEASVTAGLTDGITSYDSLFAKLSNNSIDSSVKLIYNNGKSLKQESGMGKKALTEVEIAAMAEGIQSAEVTATDEALAAALTEVQPETTDAAAALAATEQAAAAATEVTTQPEAKSDSVVDYLQGQVKGKDAELLAANIELNSVKAQLADMQAGHQGLIEIAGKSLSNMLVALGGSATDHAGMGATQVLAEHTRVSGLFASKFKSGGVAAVMADTSAKNGLVVDALTHARLNAVRTNK